jgi:hypothetical protein
MTSATSPSFGRFSNICIFVSAADSAGTKMTRPRLDTFDYLTPHLHCRLYRDQNDKALFWALFSNRIAVLTALFAGTRMTRPHFGHFRFCDSSFLLPFVQGPERRGPVPVCRFHVRRAADKVPGKQRAGKAPTVGQVHSQRVLTFT